MKPFIIVLLLFILGASAEGVTKKGFKQTLTYMNSVLQPIIRDKYNKPFLADGDWKKKRTPSSGGASFYFPMVNHEVAFGVYLVGWFARLPHMTTDALEFALCHELGHHIYGATYEVKADHFAPTCLKWLWPDEQTFKDRVLTAFAPIEELRISILKETTPKETLDLAVDCRRQAIERGIEGLPVPSCQL